MLASGKQHNVFKQKQLKLCHLLLEGTSYSSISRNLGTAPPNISKYKRKWKLELIHKPGGHPTKVFKQDRSALVCLALGSKTYTARRAKQELGIDVYTQTVKNVLKEEGRSRSHSPSNT